MDTIGFYYFRGGLLHTHEDTFTRLKQVSDYKPKYSLIDPNTYLGIEVEVERVKRTSGILALGDDAFAWRNTTDGSLRNDGKEFVSVPMRGENAIFALETLKEHFTKDKTCIAHEFTDRTSIHVHVNVRDSTVEELMKLIFTYVLVEPLLYRFAGGDRDKNIFCVPIVESNLAGTLNDAVTALENKRALDALKILNMWQKYTGFNLLPVAQYGTVEFRHLIGTADLAKITTWLNLILSVKKYASKISYEELKTSVLNINTTSDYMQVTSAIFGELTAFLDTHDIQDVMENTSTFLKDVFSELSLAKKVVDDVATKREADCRQVPILKKAVALGTITFVDIQQQIKKYQREIDRYTNAIVDTERAIKECQDLIPEATTKRRKDTLAEKILAYQYTIESYKENVKHYENLINDLITPKVKPDVNQFIRDWQLMNARPVQVREVLNEPVQGQAINRIVEDGVELEEPFADDEEEDF